MSSHVQSRGLRRICFFISVAHGVLAPFLEIIAQNNPYRVRRLPRVLTTRYLEYNLIHNRDVAKPLSACYVESFDGFVGPVPFFTEYLKEVQYYSYVHFYLTLLYRLMD